MLHVFRVMLHVFPVMLQETRATLQETRPTLQKTPATLRETPATHTTLFTKAWQIQNIDISVRKENKYIYIYKQKINRSRA